MKKVAIVGVEGSGKTVMLAGLGDLYTYPDEEGYFLSPKNFGTAAYVAEKIERMRKGEWPAATAGDETQGLDWTLKWNVPEEGGRPKSVCEVSFLDFAGEVYRMAFGIGMGDMSLAERANELKRYVSEADDLIVLINLRDVIAHGVRDKRVQEAMWITKSILDTALSEDSGYKVPRTAIVLSQADSYADTIKDCGDAKGVLKKYLPHVANDYGWLDVFAVSAVDRTKLNDDGKVVPAEDFTAKGLLPIMQWICEEKVGGGEVSDGGRGATALPGNATARRTRLSRKTRLSRPDRQTRVVSGGATAAQRVQLWQGGPYWADCNIGAEKPWESGYYFWWGDAIGYTYESNAFVASDGSASRCSFSAEGTPTLNRDIAALHGAGWIVLGEEKVKKSLLGKLFGLKERGDSFLTPAHDAAQIQWGEGWRMPTRQELEELCNKCDWTWSTMHGVNGYIVRGRGDYALNSILLPCVGRGYGTSLYSAGSRGYYWSSVPCSDNSGCAWGLDLHSSAHDTCRSGRSYGRSVRPVQGVA